MMKPAPPIPKKRRPRLKPSRVAPPPPPAAVDQVVAVVLDGSDACVVTVGADVNAIVDPSLAIWVRHEGGPFFTAIGAEILDVRHVRFTYDENISASTLWEVGEPTAWEWADGGTTQLPWDGEIA